MTRRGSMLALTVGTLWGLVEAILLFGVGTAPARDVYSVMGGTLAASVICYAPLILVARFKPHRVVDGLMTLGLLLPLVVFTGRSRIGLAAPDDLLGIVPALVGVLLVVAEIVRPRWTLSGASWLFAVFYALYAWAGIACALRSDPLKTIHASAVSNVLGADAVAVLVLFIVGLFTVGARRAPPHGFAIPITTTVLTLAVAVGAGSGPPRFSDQSLPGPAARPPDLPNVLLIVLDTVRADHLDLYGYPRPTFAKTGALLHDALVMDRATANGTFSLPSHASLFTGLLPSEHGAYPMIRRDASYGSVHPDVKTLAETLRARGFATLGLSANDVFLGDWTGLQRGFDQFLSDGRLRYQFLPFTMRTRAMLARRGILPRRRYSDRWNATEVTTAAIEVLSRERRPYFLFLNYFDAHDPHELMGTPDWMPAQNPQVVDLYDSEIAFIDGEVARLLRSLKDRGELDRTLVVVTSDHGEYFGDRGTLRGHPAAAYEGGLHVPLVLRLPGVIPSGRSERRIGLNEVNRVVGDTLSGTSLKWLNELDPSPRVLTEIWAREDFLPPRPTDGRPSTIVVFSGNVKLIHRNSGRHEMYDVASDPAEATNLIDTTDPRLMGLRDTLLQTAASRRFRAPKAPAPLSEAAQEKLRSLGYIR